MSSFSEAAKPFCCSALSEFRDRSVAVIVLRLLSKLRIRAIAMIMILVPAVIAVVGIMANIYDGLTFLGTTTTYANGSGHFVGAGLSKDTHRLTATDTRTAGSTRAASPPVGTTVVPSITSFSATPKTQFYIGDGRYSVQAAGKSYSLTNPDPQTVRFEIRPDDRAWFDGPNVERSQIAGDYIPFGTPANISYQFMVEPNGPNGSFVNTAWWLVTTELHDAGPVSTSPPVHIGLAGDRLQVVAKYCPTGLDPSNAAGNLTDMVLWTDPNPIQPGQYNDIKISAKVSNDSSGYLDVWVNGTQVVNYDGPLGYGNQTYWEEGLYRNAGPSETVAAKFRDLMITTGSR